MMFSMMFNPIRRLVCWVTGHRWRLTWSDEQVMLWDGQRTARPRLIYRCATCGEPGYSA
jgi:hypothetical protein